MKVELSALHFHRIINNTLPFASTDHVRLALCTLRLSLSDAKGVDGRLTATSTDGYQIAVDSAPCTIYDLPADLSHLLFPLDRMIEAARAAKKEGKHGGVTITIEALPRLYATLRFHLSGITLAFDLLDGRHPNIDALWPSGEVLLDVPVLLSPERMARYAKVKVDGGNPILLLTFRGALKPVEVQIGETFRSLIMPIRP